MITTFKQNFKTALDAAERSPGFFIWLYVLAVLILMAGYTLVASLVMSLEILEFSTRIPWAGLIAAYLFLVISGSGLCIINALGAVFGMHRYERMTRRIVFLSLTTIVFGMSCIVLHLGHPERMPIYNAISPNFHSAISWMGALYTIYLVIVTLEFWLLIRDDLAEQAEQSGGMTGTLFGILALKKLDGSRLGTVLKNPGLLRIISALAFVTGVCALSTLGSVFAHSESRALWYGAYFPVYFIHSSLFSGYAFLLSVTIISYRVRGDEIFPDMKPFIFEMARILAFLLATGLVMTAYRLATGLYDPATRGPVMLFIDGDFSVAFWFFEVGLMSVGAGSVLLVSAWKKSITGVLSGSLMALAGAFVMRYIFVVAGQVYPNIRKGLPSYMPTLMEIFLIGGTLGAFLMVYTLGEKFLPLKE